MLLFHCDANRLAVGLTVGAVCTICKLQTQNVFAGRQSQLGFGLAFTEMLVLRVHRNDLVFWHRIGVDQHMVMPGARFDFSCCDVSILAIMHGQL